MSSSLLSLISVRMILTRRPTVDLANFPTAFDSLPEFEKISMKMSSSSLLSLFTGTLPSWPELTTPSLELSDWP